MIVAGGTLGLAVSGMLAWPMLAPLQSQAGEQVKSLIGPAAAAMLGERGERIDGLVKFDVVFEPNVSQEPLGSSVVRKIAFGKTTFVTVATTASGVYSSDAVGSPHVRYPGIHVTPRQPLPVAGGLAFLAEGPFWHAIPAVGAGSFVLLDAFEGGGLSTGPEGNCVIMAKAVYC